jgi:murein DD-endopeptidase MepM/ murein hydrolase activator NlpD
MGRIWYHMGKKHLSVILIPHTKTSSKTYSFSKRTVKGAMWGGIVLGTLLLGVTADYVRIQLSSRSYGALKVENDRQKAAIAKYETSMDDLQSKVKSFDEYTKKLNLMLGITADTKLQEFNVGDYPRDAQAVPNGGQIQPPASGVSDLRRKTEDIQKNLETLVTYSESRASFLASQPSIWPTNGWTSSGFGYRMDPFTQKQAFHYGLDIVATYGNPIIAPADGFVAEVNRSGQLGNSIVLSHGGGITTMYGHLSKIDVRAGQKIKRGDLLGNVGNTGKSIGPHLHYEVRLNGKPVNPYMYILE